MPKLKFNVVGEKRVEGGDTDLVLFIGEPVKALAGVACDGLTKFNESPEGGDANDQYANNIKWISLRGPENFKGDFSALMYPKAFNACMGLKEVVEGSGAYVGQQARETFSYCYKTLVGSDTKGFDYSEKLHIGWNATCSPVSKAYETLTESPNGMEFNWSFDTVPMPITKAGFKPTAHLEFERPVGDSAEIKKFQAAYDELCAELYGTDGEGGKTSGLLLPDDVISIIEKAKASA